MVVPDSFNALYNSNGKTILAAVEDAMEGTLFVKNLK